MLYLLRPFPVYREKQRQPDCVPLEAYAPSSCPQGTTNKVEQHLSTLHLPQRFWQVQKQAGTCSGNFTSSRRTKHKLHSSTGRQIVSCGISELPFWVRSHNYALVLLFFAFFWVAKKQRKLSLQGLQGWCSAPVGAMPVLATQHS